MDDEWMRHFMRSKGACKEHAVKALIAFRRSPRIRAMREKIILPDEIAGWCVKMKMPVGERTLGVSFSISPDRMGNRSEFGEIGPEKPPSTSEIILMGSVGDFSDLDKHLGYDGDIRSFGWDSTPGAPEGGFAEVIDELVRLRAVLDGIVSAFADSPDTHEWIRLRAILDLSASDVPSHEHEYCDDDVSLHNDGTDDEYEEVEETVADEVTVFQVAERL
jgi:hypothetical protein